MSAEKAQELADNGAWEASTVQSWAAIAAAAERIAEALDELNETAKVIAFGDVAVVQEQDGQSSAPVSMERGDIDGWWSE